MKPEELRLGNYIYNVGDIEQIASICHDSVNTNKEISINIDLLSPIPLTEDLLIKCGFELDCDYVFCKNIEGCGEFTLISTNHPTAMSNNIDGIFYYGFNKCIFSIYYLNQLQNLYYCITGKELEIRL